MQAIARDWKAIGVEAAITLRPTDLVFGKKGAGVISRRDFDAVVWQVSTMDAAGGYTMLHSSQIPIQANRMTGENYFGWRNARADDLLARARSSPDESERLAAYREHQALFMEDLPALPPLLPRPDPPGPLRRPQLPPDELGAGRGHLERRRVGRLVTKDGRAESSW